MQQFTIRLQVWTVCSLNENLCRQLTCDSRESCCGGHWYVRGFEKASRPLENDGSYDTLIAKEKIYILQSAGDSWLLPYRKGWYAAAALPFVTLAHPRQFHPFLSSSSLSFTASSTADKAFWSMLLSKQPPSKSLCLFLFLSYVTCWIQAPKIYPYPPLRPLCFYHLLFGQHSKKGWHWGYR